MHALRFFAAARVLILACIFFCASILPRPANAVPRRSDLPAALAAEDATWIEMDSGSTEILSGVWGSEGIYFAVGSQGAIQRFDGIRWSPMTSGTTEDFQGIWGTSPIDVYAVGGGGTVLHYNGNQWTHVNTPTTEFLRGAWGTSFKDVFITGTRGTIIHYDGIRWESMESNSPNRLYDIWGAANDDIFVAGHLATILHFDGINWSSMASGVRPTLWGVWGASGDNVFVVGGSGVIVHFDGLSWEQQETGTSEDLLRIWGSNADDVFCVGSGGTILRWDGQTWAPMNTPTGRTLKSVFGDSTGNVFAVGDAGTILRLSPSVPVFVDYFDAAVDGMEVALEWRINSCDAVDAFIIKRIELQTNNHKFFRFDADAKSTRDTALQPGNTYHYTLTARLFDGTQVASRGIEVTLPTIPTGLTSVYPNPFNPATTIRYRVGSHAQVNVSIYNVRGSLVRHLVDEPSHGPGVFAVGWDGLDHLGRRSASGIYFCTLKSNDRVETLRLVLIK